MNNDYMNNFNKKKIKVDKLRFKMSNIGKHLGR